MPPSNSGQRRSARQEARRKEMVSVAGITKQKNPNAKKSFDQLVKRIKAELNATNPAWPGLARANLGAAAIAGLVKFCTDTKIREQVNKDGGQYGCHTCLTKVETDKNQPWIGDHCPPTKLNAKARKALGLDPAPDYIGRKVDLRPQCHECSRVQAELVQRLNASPNSADPEDLRFLGLHSRHVNGIPATSATVSPGEGVSIQRLGTLYGCHTCGTRYPTTSYHADHNPPVLLTQSHVSALLEIEDEQFVEPTEFRFLPQCPRCSGEQGGHCAAIARQAAEVCEMLGVTKY